MGPPLDENGTFQVWGCCGNLCRQPSNQRACRVFLPSPLGVARGWAAGLARRILRQGTRTRSGRLQSDDSDPSPARCKLKKQTSPTSCSSPERQSFATYTRTLRHQEEPSSTCQPRSTAAPDHHKDSPDCRIDVSSASPSASCASYRRNRLPESKRDATQPPGWRWHCPTLFFLVSNDDVTVGIGAMMEWMSQEPMRPTPSSHCDDKSLLSRPNCSPVAPTSRSLDHRRHGIYRCSPWMENPKLQQVSVTGSSATLVGALWCWSRPPPFCLSRPPMTHLHEKLLHEKRRHLVRAARSDGHFDGLHRPRNKTSITGWASQPMGGPWWEKPIKKSFEFCRLQNLAQLHAVYFGRHHCQSFRQPRECPPIPYAGGLFLVSGSKKKEKPGRAFGELTSR